MICLYTVYKRSVLYNMYIFVNTVYYIINYIILKVFNQSVYSVLRQALGERGLATPDMAMAWRTFFFDCNTPNILGIGSSNRPGTYS